MCFECQSRNRGQEYEKGKQRAAEQPDGAPLAVKRLLRPFDRKCFLAHFVQKNRLLR